jgi:hypothetical protein
MDHHLTEKQEEFCMYAGILGSAASLICLIQHFIITRPHWISYLMAFAYVLAIISFILLTLKNYYSSLLLLISAVALSGTEVFLAVSGVFSLLVLLLTIFALVISIFLLIENYPAKFKQRQLALQKEKDEWNGIL